jgi:hypothetical protein
MPERMEAEGKRCIYISAAEVMIRAGLFTSILLIALSTG